MASYSNCSLARFALSFPGTPQHTDFLFQEAFLTTYRTFITPKALIDKLLYRYNKFLQVKDTRQKIAINAFALMVRVVDDLW